MAKRFIDTEFYKSPFVRGLNAPLKGLYTFIICDCTAGGIWAADFPIASMYIGQNVTKEEFEDFFVKAGKAINLKDGKYFIPDFIEHQYPNGLSESNPAQKKFIRELKKYNLLDEELKPLARPFQGSKVVVMEKVTEVEAAKEMAKVKTIRDFDLKFIDPKILSTYQDYLKMRSSINKPFKSLLSIEANYKQLLKLSSENLDIAKQIIEQSIANQWQGFFEIKQLNKQHDRTKKVTPGGFGTL